MLPKHAVLEVKVDPDLGDATLQLQLPLVRERAPAYDWMLALDNDEFLVLAPPSRSLPHYVAEQQRSHGAPIHAFQFNWAYADAFNPLCSSHPTRATLASLRLAPDFHVKTMARVSHVSSWDNPHAPVLNQAATARAAGRSETSAPCVRRGSNSQTGPRYHLKLVGLSSTPPHMRLQPDPERWLLESLWVGGQGGAVAIPWLCAR